MVRDDVDALCEQYAPLIFTKARQFVRSDGDAIRLFEAVLIQAAAEWPNKRDKRPVSVWLIQMTLLLAIRHLRAIPDSSPALAVPIGATTVKTLLRSNDALVHVALLYHLGGYQPAEIATLLTLREGNVVEFLKTFWNAIRRAPST